MSRVFDLFVFRYFIIILASGWFSGCNDSRSVKDAVLSEGQSVEASNKNGTIKITYISPTKRRYDWDGTSRVVKMIARTEPFQGKQGLYEPADSLGLNPFAVRLVVEESVRNFDSEDELRAALIQSSAIADWVYTGDGLVVGFGRAPSRKQINVDLFQFLLQGQKPFGLVGARPDQIRMIKPR